MMKILKGIGLFIVYPILFLGLGFYTGVKTTHFFYPGEQSRGRIVEPYDADLIMADEVVKTEDEVVEPEPSGESDESVEAAFMPETLSVDTEYVLEEADILNNTAVETTWRLPTMYVGMDREQFIEAMENYEISPPLSELERGFVSLEVLSFSRERVVVRKNYRLVQPSESFYLAVYDNEVVVYLEDKMTIYIETEIKLDSLPEELQESIMGMMWVENEEKLYNFLENYSS